MKKIVITASPKCDFCGQPATCRGRYEDQQGPSQNACDTCCGHGNEDGHCKPIEIFICGKVKCDWQGQDHELNYVRNPNRPGPKTLPTLTGECPQCGNTGFYIRPISAAKKGASK